MPSTRTPPAVATGFRDPDQDPDLDGGIVDRTYHRGRYIAMQDKDIICRASGCSQGRVNSNTRHQARQQRTDVQVSRTAVHLVAMDASVSLRPELLGLTVGVLCIGSAESAGNAEVFDLGSTLKAYEYTAVREDTNVPESHDKVTFAGEVVGMRASTVHHRDDFTL